MNRLNQTQKLKNKMRFRRILLIILFTQLVCNHSYAQLFWDETFGVGCNQGTLANNYLSSNGTWLVTSTGTNDLFANQWYISGTESGFTVGTCGSGCLINAGFTNQTLHIGS